MRATTHARSRTSGILLLALAGCVLLPQAADAKKAVKLTTVGNPPAAEVTAGTSFNLAAKLKNRSKKATRPKVTIRLKSARTAKGSVVGSRRLAKVKAGKSRRFKVNANVPAGLAAGRYYVKLCAKARGKKACRLAARRLTVRRPGAPGTPGTPPGPRYRVLLFTEGADVGVAAAIDAFKAIGKDENFNVTESNDSSVFTSAKLDDYRAIVFVNTSGDILTDAEQQAFEAYFKAGGGFLALNRAIGTEMDWPFMSQLLGTRPGTAVQTQATVKVADRVHEASKDLPEYWQRTDRYFNFVAEPVIRGNYHVLATVDETTYTGGTMGFDHPAAWCKDVNGGRTFYTIAGGTADAYADANVRKHLGGAVEWAAGQANPVYSDCGATVLSNFEQVKISAPPFLNEPIGFDQLPDGRIIQTVRDGRVRLHNPDTGQSTLLADFRANTYTNSEDGMYGPAVDNNFATNKWVYLYYAPINMSGVAPDGKPYPAQTPPGSAPTTAPNISDWDAWQGYFQLSRFKFVDGDQPRLDMGSEQKIMKVHNNRGACCHVAGDIDFDTNNTLWLVTGDDTPAGGGNSGGFSPHNDMKTNETQAVRVFNANGGTFTLTFNGQTTAPIAWNATAATVQAALRALSNLADADVVATGGPVNTGNVSVNFRGAYTQQNLTQMTTNGAALTGAAPAASAAIATTAEGSATTNERQTLRLNDATGGTFTLTFAGQTTAALPYNATAAEIQAALVALSNVGPTDVTVTGGPVHTATVTVLFTGALGQTNLGQLTADVSAVTNAPTAVTTTTQEGDWFQAPFVDARRTSLNTNDLRGKVLRINVKPDGSYTAPGGNLFPESDDLTGETRPEIYAMGFRNPFRIQVDSDGVAYVTDYSPDSQTPENFRGPAGTGRVEIVRKAANYGWPLCYSPTLPYYKWDFNTSTTLGEPYECGNPDHGPANTSRWNTGRTFSPPITQPDIWYSYRDNASPPLGTPCFAYYNGSGATSCPQLFPELGTGGVGPHGADKYEWDENNPSETKFPPYYDNSIMVGEFTRDWLREVKLDSQNKVFKINQTLNCGQALVTTAFPFECDNPMDMQFGDDGNLYLLTYGDGFFAANPDAGMYRFEYVAGPQRPKAVASATPTSGVAPLTVQFSSAGSNDPDPNDSIRFEWNFGDGSPISVDPNPSHVYTTNGKYTATLTVFDASGKSSSRSVEIVVGNTAPKVVINTPVDGDFFEWGQSIPFSVTVTDPEDQAGGAAIDCSRVQVTLVLVHDTHGHGEAQATGCTGVLATSAEDASHGGYIAAGISVSYTDKGIAGANPLTTTTQHVVQTRRQQVEFSQDLRGLTTPAVAAPEVDPGGGQAVSAIDPGDYVALNNRYYFGNMDNSITFRFANNAAAGTLRGLVDVHLDAVGGPVVGTCELRATGDNGVYTSQTCALTLTAEQESQSHRIYLVFRQATGGPATGFGNLNWVQFTGPGWGV